MTINPDNTLLQPCDFIIGRTMANPHGYTCNTSSVFTFEFSDGSAPIHLCEEHQPKKIFKIRR